MGIRIRLSLLLLFTVTLSAAGLWLFHHSQNQRNQELFAAEAAERNTLYDQLTLLRGRPLQMIAEREYSIWDEMAAFVTRPDSAWAHTNLDLLLTMYGFSAVWVFRPDFALVYAVSDSSGPDLSTLLAGTHLEAVMARQPLCHFFFVVSGTPVEIRGASIHPTSDTGRATPPCGWLFIARRWNRQYLRELEVLLDSRITVLPGQRSARQAKSDIMTGRISFHRTLPGWNGEPVAQLVIHHTSKPIRALTVSFHQQLLLLTALFAGLMTMLALAMHFWIAAPLEQLADTLRNRNPVRIAGLQRRPDEFGQLARLIADYFRQESELAASEQRYRQLVENLNEGISIIDSDERFVFANPAANRIFGVAPARLEGRNLQEFLDETGRLIIQHQTERRRQGEKSRYELTITRPDGRTRTLVLDVSPRFDDQRNFLGAFAIFADITEQKQIEEELARHRARLEMLVEERTRELKAAQERLVQQEKQAILGQVAARFAHELRNPLGIIRNARYCLDNPDRQNNPEPRKYLQMIDLQIERINRIITSLIQFTEERPPARQIISAQELVAQALNECPVPESVVVHQSLPAVPLQLFVDPEQVRIALVNIIRNALQAMPAGGELRIRVVPDNDGRAAIEVTDTGNGIPAELLPQLFSPLFSTRTYGLGLGLSTAWSMVTRNGGTIQVASEPATGSTFTLLLPVAASGAN